jgi:hypothetical protein
MHPPDILCYRLSYYMPYDPEVVWSLVERHGGWIGVLPGGHYDFHIDRRYALLVILAFPLLSRQPQRDLYL